MGADPPATAAAPRAGRRTPAAVWLLAAAVAVASGVPYLVVWASTGPGEVYTGLIFNPADTNQYLAWMREAADGHLVLGNAYAPESAPRLLVRPLFTLLGLVAGATGLVPVVVYHLARIALVFLLVRVIYGFAALYLPRGPERVGATFLATLAGGLGAPLAAAGVSFGERLRDAPIDLWVPEAHVFQTAYLYPHLLFAQVLLFTAIGAGARALRDGRLGPLLLAWAAASGLALEHPFDSVVVAAVLTAFALRRVLATPARTPRVLGTLALVTLPAAALVAAQVVVLRSHETFAWLLAGPSQAHLTASGTILGLGLLPPLLLLSLALERWGVRRTPSPPGAPPGTTDDGRTAAFDRLEPLLFLAVVLLLVGAPLFDIRRRFLMGIQVPIAVATVGTLAALLRQGVGRRTLGWLLAGVALLGLPGNVLRVVADVDRAQAPAVRQRLVHSAAQRDLYAWLDARSAADGGTGPVVLADPLTGNELPAYAAVRVFAGHWAHTPYYRERTAALRALRNTPAAGAAFLSDQGVTHVLVVHARDPEGSLLRLAAAVPWLRRAHENEAGVIFAAEPALAARAWRAARSRGAAAVGDPPEQAATAEFLARNEARYRAALERATAWLDGLTVDPAELRAVGIKGKKKLVEILDAYQRLHAVAPPEREPALAERIRELVAVTYTPAYHDMGSVDDRHFKQDATSYLRAALLMEDLGFDTALYRDEIRKVHGRLNRHMQRRGPNQRMAFHWYYAHFGLDEPFDLAAGYQLGVIAERRDPYAMDVHDAYSLTHEIFIPYEYGENLDVEFFDPDERAWLRHALERLTVGFLMRRNADLSAELLSCLRYLDLTDLAVYREGLDWLLAAQNPNGSWGDYEHLRERHGRFVDPGWYLHTTAVAVDALTVAFESASLRDARRAGGGRTVGRAEGVAR